MADRRTTRIVGLVLAVVLCCGASDCDDEGTDSSDTSYDPGGSTPAPENTETLPSAQEVAGLIEGGARTWLSGFNGLAPLTCPQTADAVVTASGSDMQACGFFEGDAFIVRMQNRSSVPMSVWGRRGIDPVYTVLPQKTLDLTITNPEYGQYLSYQADTIAGLTSVVVKQVQEELNERLVPGYGWTTCAVRPTPDCLLSGLSSLLPKQVTIRGYRIPLRLLGDGLAIAYENRNLLSSFAGDAVGAPPGTLTIAQP